jgi:hypothetical protein
MWTNEGNNPALDEARISGPVNTIRTSIIETASGLDQHVQAHEKAWQVSFARIITLTAMQMVSETAGPHIVHLDYAFVRWMPRRSALESQPQWRSVLMQNWNGMRSRIHWIFMGHRAVNDIDRPSGHLWQPLWAAWSFIRP